MSCDCRNYYSYVETVLIVAFKDEISLYCSSFIAQ